MKSLEQMKRERDECKANMAQIRDEIRRSQKEGIDFLHSRDQMEEVHLKNIEKRYTQEKETKERLDRIIAGYPKEEKLQSDLSRDLENDDD